MIMSEQSRYISNEFWKFYYRFVLSSCCCQNLLLISIYIKQLRIAEKMNKCTFWLIFKINPVSNPGHPGQSLNKKPGQIAIPFGRVLNSVPYAYHFPERCALVTRTVTEEVQGLVILVEQPAFRLKRLILSEGSKKVSSAPSSKFPLVSL